MRKVVATLLLNLLLSPAAYTLDIDQQLRCQQTKEKIRKIQSRMRQGYNARQGIRMDEELRRLRKLRSKHCH
jgi:hypothetical protein